MRIFIICFLSICTLFSCSDEIHQYPVGSDFIDNDISIKVIDTFTIETGTFKLDSLITSNTSRILLGSIIDENFGHLTSQSYFELRNSDFSIDDDASYSSIGFVLNYDSYIYGDTTQTQTYKVHRLLETVEPDEGDSFYNTSNLDYDPIPLGELTFTPRPNKPSDSLYIPLSDELGEEIFNKIRDDDINNIDDFTQFFKGITIVPDTSSNTNVLGFEFLSSSVESGSSYMRLFFEEEDDDNEDNEKTIDFFISSAEKQFNAIETNLESTPINQFEDAETIIPDNETNNSIFAQAGTGISARIEMPTLKRLNTLSNQAAALKSELRFTPLKNTYDNNKPLKDSLLVFVVDHKNRIVNQLTDIESIASYAILHGNNNEFNQDTYYSLDMSGFVETILSSEFDLNYAIMIQFVDYNKSVDSVVIDSFNEENNDIRLIVNYLTY